MKRLFHLSVLVLLVLSACTTPATSTPSPTKAPPTKTKTALPQPTRTPRPVVLDACVTDSTIRIRSGPGTDQEVIGGLVSGTCMSIVGRNRDSSWVYMVADDNTQGWVSGSLLTVDGELSRVSIISESVAAIARATSTRVPQLAATSTRPPVATRTPRPVIVTSDLLCSQTSSKVGERVTCKIERAYCDYVPSANGAPTFCNDRPYPNQNFALVVFGEDWSSLDGYCIMVSGLVYLYRGVPQIEATSLSQVGLCE